MEITNLLTNALIATTLLIFGLGIAIIGGILHKRIAEKAWLRRSLIRGIRDGVPILFLGFALTQLGHSLHFDEYLVQFEKLKLLIPAIVNTIGWGVFVMRLSDLFYYLIHGLALKTASSVDTMLTPVLGRLFNWLILIMIILHLGHVITGIPIATILTGLGIGGLAVALAAQDTLKNVFGAFVIILEKPFNIGERVTLDGHDGTIESVGLRSTRLRRLDGHLVTIPNSLISNTAIHNVAKREFIRRNFTVSVTYDTSPEKLRQAKEIIEALLKDHEGMNPEKPPRVYFNELNSYSLDFLCIYWYFPPEFWDYLAFTERFNIELVSRFNAAGIQFAFPSQTIYWQPEQQAPSQPLPAAQADTN